MANTVRSAKRENIIDNPRSFKILVILSMLYMSFMLCNYILANRYVGGDHWFVLGGTLIAPIIFIMDGIIAEIYGYKVAQTIILTGFGAQTLFALIAQVILNSPHPAFFKDQIFYSSILGSSFLWIDLKGFVAYVSANLVNSYVITRWKVLLKGKHFWLRSLGASTLSEGLYSFLAILMMEINTISFNDVLKIVLLSYLIKIIYSLVLIGPVNLLVNYLKNYTGTDVYDFPKNFTPFSYQNSKELS